MAMKYLGADFACKVVDPVPEEVGHSPSLGFGGFESTLDLLLSRWLITA